MATIKAYTDIEQSRKLAEILSVDSADMCLTFVNNTWNPVWGKADDIYQFQKDCYEPDYTKDDYIDIDEFEPKIVPSWSLAALLSVLDFPALTQIKENKWELSIIKHNNDKYIDVFADNPIDTCVFMIEILHERKML